MTQQYDLYLNGQWVKSQSDEWLEVVNPANKEVIAQVPAAQEADVEIAVEGAYNALNTWKFMEVDKRIQYMEKIFKYLKDHADDIAITLSKELGVPMHKAKDMHVAGYFDEIETYIKTAREMKYIEEKDGYELHKEPVGVVALITPWNYPFGQIVRKFFPALLTGNTVVLKPSQKTPLTAYYFADACEQVGIPDGVFQLLPGRGSEVGDLLATHKLINKISFTGSTKGGTEIAQQAVSGVKRVTLELGGKSPAIILEDADLELAAKQVLNTVYSNVGQSCSAATRVLAPRAMRDQVEKAFVDRTKEYTFGHPEDENTDVGPLQSEQQYEKVTEFIKKGKESATLLYEGETQSTEGYNVPPVIFTDVDNKSEIAQEEIFGPVLSIIYYDTLDEALTMANDVKYGLSAMVFGEESKAKEVAKQILSGEVFINDSGDSTNAPFGGFKQSGMGREGGPYALDEYLELKAVIV